MPKKNRLSGAEIRSIRSPRRLSSGLFSLSISPATSDTTHIACVVSKKVSPRAVVRNQVKRRCRAACAKYIKGLPNGVYVLTVKKETARSSYGDIERDIAELFVRARGVK